MTLFWDQHRAKRGLPKIANPMTGVFPSGDLTELAVENGPLIVDFLIFTYSRW